MYLVHEWCTGLDPVLFCEHCTVGVSRELLRRGVNDNAQFLWSGTRELGKVSLWKLVFTQTHAEKLLSNFFSSPAEHYAGIKCLIQSFSKINKVSRSELLRKIKSQKPPPIQSRNLRYIPDINYIIYELFT